MTHIRGYFILYIRAKGKYGLAKSIEPDKKTQDLIPHGPDPVGPPNVTGGPCCDQALLFSYQNNGLYLETQ